MTASRAYGLRTGSVPSNARAASPPDPARLLGAVREDIRQTLRTAWVDSSLEDAAAYPMFFTAAWSAIRPNVGRSFLLLARTLRSEAADGVRPSLEVGSLRKRLEADLSDEELRRLEEAARAVQLSTAKVQVVVHALHRVARRERIPGTGREEPSIRRGIPDWQRWMSFQPVPDDAQRTLGRATAALGLPAPPMPLRVFARWPSAIAGLAAELRRLTGSQEWKARSLRLRRVVIGGIGNLPHPIDLQWMALRARGFTEEDREALADVMARHDAAMPQHTLIAAVAWAALGAPDVGAES